LYDLIGDIHGHADELTRLLELLGYDQRQGHYTHPSRKVVFVGDFIDRGPQIREVLQVVRPMIASGSALAVMGNHEFNAIAYHTRDPEDENNFLRPHTAKNVAQHCETLRQIPSEELYEHIEWFRTLPLWLELDGLRVVHACWDKQHVSTIDSALRKHGGVTTGFLANALAKETSLYKAVDAVLKGKELRLPDGVVFYDKDGHERHDLRVRWFDDPTGKTYREYALATDEGFPSMPIPDEAINEAKPYGGDEPPVFFGHYWLRAAKPVVQAPNVACLDYSVAKGGSLCAYRWGGEQQLDNSRFIVVPSG